MKERENKKLMTALLKKQLSRNLTEDSSYKKIYKKKKNLLFRVKKLLITLKRRLLRKIKEYMKNC